MYYSRIKNKAGIIFFILLFACRILFACTIFSATRGGKILTAKNQDYTIVDTRMLVVPPEQGKFGIIYFGDKNPEGFCNTSGANDQGLWYAGASVPERGDVKNFYNKPRITGELIEKILEECASVEQAMDMFSTYYTPHWNGHFLLTDKTGRSVIVEYGERDVAFIRPKADYQVATNFYMNDYTNERWNNCYRYNVADYLLKNSKEISQELFRSICDLAHIEGPSTTALSTIHDLKTGDIYIYNFHNFEEVVKINMFEELNKGWQYCQIPKLFHQIKQQSPRSGQTVDPYSVKLKWQGNGENYLVFCSQDSNFLSCIPVKTSISSFSQNINSKKLGLVLAIPLLFPFFLKMKKLPYMLAIFVILCPLLTCQIDILDPPESSQKNHAITIENLEPQTKYYWKVQAINKNGMNSESIVWNFLTGERKN